MLLQMLSGKERRIQKLRQTAARKLLEKPAVKPHLSAFADGLLDPAVMPERQGLQSENCFRLSLDVYGEESGNWRWKQVSRKGVSLVLQLNLNLSITEKLKRCYVDDDGDPFCSYHRHPAREGDFPTLGWARLDFDLETGEALIEELQSDLLRDFREVTERAHRARKSGDSFFSKWGTDFHTDRVIRLWQEHFSELERSWNEALLSASLWFLVSELGMKRIFYHTFETGSYLKGITGRRPPRSLYTDLPRRFCFEETGEVPELLAAEKDWKKRVRKAPGEMRFFRMAV